MAAVMEYLAAEVLELAGNAARDNKLQAVPKFHSLKLDTQGLNLPPFHLHPLEGVLGEKLMQLQFQADIICTNPFLYFTSLNVFFICICSLSLGIISQ